MLGIPMPPPMPMPPIGGPFACALMIWSMMSCALSWPSAAEMDERAGSASLHELLLGRTAGTRKSSDRRVTYTRSSPGRSAGGFDPSCGPFGLW